MWLYPIPIGSEEMVYHVMEMFIFGENHYYVMLAHGFSLKHCV